MSESNGVMNNIDKPFI